VVWSGAPPWGTTNVSSKWIRSVGKKKGRSGKGPFVFAEKTFSFLKGTCKQGGFRCELLLETRGTEKVKKFVLGQRQGSMEHSLEQKVRLGRNRVGITKVSERNEQEKSATTEISVSRKADLRTQKKKSYREAK